MVSQMLIMYIILTGCSETVNPDPVVGSDYRYAVCRLYMCAYDLCLYVVYFYKTYTCRYICDHMSYYVYLVYRISCTICYSLYYFIYGLI